MLTLQEKREAEKEIERERESNKIKRR